MAHELGHIVYMKFFLKKTLKYTWIKNSIIGLEIEPIEGMTDSEHNKALWVGLIIGLVPIIAAYSQFEPSLLLVAPYLYIMKYDLKEAVKGIHIEDEFDSTQE